MKNNFILFFKQKLSDFYQALINLFMFFPYFFSVPTLIKTLFFPWKNLVTKDKTVGFSLSSWISTAGFNLISMGMGFIMRSTIILFYFIFQALLLILLPFIFLLYMLVIPLLYFEGLTQKTEDEKKEIARL